MVKRKQKIGICNNDRLLSESIPPNQLKKLRSKGFIERNKIIQDALNKCQKNKRRR